MRQPRQRLTVGGVVGRVDAIRQDDGDHCRNRENHDLARPRPTHLLDKPPPHGKRLCQYRGPFGVSSAGACPVSPSCYPAWRPKPWHATLSGPALLAQLVEHFHGKEGVVGSSPTEGLVSRICSDSGWGTVRRCTSGRMRTSSTRSVERCSGLEEPAWRRTNRRFALSRRLAVPPPSSRRGPGAATTPFGEAPVKRLYPSAPGRPQRF
jgi:hypothetical protein